MEINEFNYIFKVRPSQDVALNLSVIYKNLGYSKIDKNRISTIFNLDKEIVNEDQYLHHLTLKVDIINSVYNNKLINMCEQLQQKWDEYKNEYFNIISKVFNIDINHDITTFTYCYLQLLPINEVDLKDNVIYLDANKNIEESFKDFIIMLTKAILLNRWSDVNNWAFDIEFDIANKIWMFAEVAIDAIFSNCDLAKICSNPTYKYFYNLKCKNENVMEFFRKEYKLLSLDKFFESVYIFVHDKYQTLLQFKHYLY